MVCKKKKIVWVFFFGNSRGGGAHDVGAFCIARYPCSNVESAAWEVSLMDLVVKKKKKKRLALHYFDCRGIAYATSFSVDKVIPP